MTADPETLRALAAERDMLSNDRGDFRASWMDAQAGLAAARAEAARLREALLTLRGAITDPEGHNEHSIIDTVWVSSVETAVDFIDAALAQKEGGE